MGSIISRLRGGAAAAGEGGSGTAATDGTNQPSATESTAKVYSWDKRRQEGTVDASRYEYKGLKGQFVMKAPGEVAGQSMNISQCTDSTILIFDHCASVTIDDCKNCRILVGPTSGSVFMRDCKHMKCAVICKQFRARDCKRVSTSLCCTSNPTLEASQHMSFACLQLVYANLDEQLEAAGISAFDNMWHDVYDFNKDDIEPEERWTFFDPRRSDAHNVDDTALDLELYLDKICDTHGNDMSLCTQVESSLIPHTAGQCPVPQQQSCLIVFCEADRPGTVSFMRAFGQKAIKSLQSLSPNEGGGTSVVRTKLTTVTLEDCRDVFSHAPDDDHKAFATRGPIVGMEVHGEDPATWCADTARTLGEEGVAATKQQRWGVYDDDLSTNAITKFFQYAGMMMSR